LPHHGPAAMLLLERDPLVRAGELPRDPSLGDCPGGLPTHAARRDTLFLWVVVVALMHFDRGAASVAAMDIVLNRYEEMEQLSFFYLVALLAWHSIGLALGSMVAGAAFQRASAKLVLVLSLATNAIALFLLGVQAHGLVLTALLRAVSGTAASFPLAYLPLWVDEFSPVQARGRWMAIVQLGTPAGQFLGVFLASIVTFGFRASWRYAVIVQALALIPAMLYLLVMPARQIDVANVASLSARLDSLTLYSSEGSTSIGHLHGLLREVREIMQAVSRNPLTVSISTVLCLLHSIGAGLAIWTGPYLALGDGAPPPLAAVLVSGCTLAAMPLLGTCAGAVLCERWEGFKAGHHAAALRVACAFVGLAALAAPASAVAAGFAARLGVVCLWLFGAGAFLPISVGILMTAMPSYLRSFSAISSVLVFHLVGFALVPGVVAVSMSCFSRSSHGLGFGVGVAFWTTVPAAVLLLLAYTREPKSTAPVGLSGVDDLTFGDISYELARRRMSTAPL